MATQLPSQGVILLRGQCVCGRRMLGEALGLRRSRCHFWSCPYTCPFTWQGHNSLMKLEVWVGLAMSSFLPGKSWDSMAFKAPYNSLISINPHGHFKFIFFYSMCSLWQAFLDVDGSSMILKNSTYWYLIVLG